MRAVIGLTFLIAMSVNFAADCVQAGPGPAWVRRSVNEQKRAEQPKPQQQQQQKSTSTPAKTPKVITGGGGFEVSSSATGGGGLDTTIVTTGRLESRPATSADVSPASR